MLCKGCADSSNMRKSSLNRLITVILNLVVCLHQAYASSVLTIDADFSGSSIMEYLRDSRSNFNERSINKQKISGSVAASDYIFHNVNEEITHNFTIENRSRQRINLILFANLPLSVLIVKEIENERLQTMKENSYLREIGTKSLVPFVQLKVNPGVNNYEITTSKIGAIGAAQLFLKTEKEFSLYEKELLIYISLIFGAVASLLLYNIFLLSVNKSWNIFNFTMICLFLGMVEATISGANSVFNLEFFTYSSRLWPLFTNLAASFFGLYLKEANYASHKIIGNRLFYFSIGVTNIISLLCVVFAEDIHYEIQIIATFFGIFISAFFPYLFGKYRPIDHAVFISSFPLIVSTTLFVLQVSNVIHVEANMVRVQLITSVAFLLCLSIYTGNKTHKNRLEKVRLQEMITLGRSVQDLLLPKRLEGSSSDIKYIFAYEPFEGKMSGDWIKYWRTKNGNHQFLLGDVTGKGPQAALAVSIISTVVDRCIRLDNDAKTALIQINKTLFNLLKGNMGSTASAAMIKPNGSLTLFNTAGIGWVIHDFSKSRHILGKSGILGQKSFVEIFEAHIPESTWEYIYTFSDGVCNGPRAVRHLSKHLQTIRPGNLDSIALRGEVMGVSKLVGDPQDDKTFLLISSRAS
jgi:hypothetical protein